jgi:hypothetical protein
MCEPARSILKATANWNAIMLVPTLVGRGSLDMSGMVEVA